MFLFLRKQYVTVAYISDNLTLYPSTCTTFLSIALNINLSEVESILKMSGQNRNLAINIVEILKKYIISIVAVSHGFACT